MALTQTEIDTIITNITTASSEPKSANTDGVSMTTHSLSEQIKLLKYLQSQLAVQSPTRGLRISRIRSNNALGTTSTQDLG